MSQPKTWKERLLKTGLPLEQDVRNVLRKVGVPYANELSFERWNEEGRLIVCSADVFGKSSAGCFDVRLLIECKYRHQASRWLFAPTTLRPNQRRTMLRVHNVLPQLHPEYRPDRSHLAQEEPVPVVGNGVEFKDGNEKDGYDAEINRAVYQLRYGCQRLMLDYLYGLADGGLRGRENIPAFVPIICTAAELWTLRDTAGVAEVESADEIEEVADQVAMVLMHAEPSRQDRQAFQMGVAGMHDTARRELERLCAEHYGHSLETFAHDVGHRPSFFFVVNFEALERLVEQTLGFFERMPFEKVEKVVVPDMTVPSGFDAEL